MNAYRRHALLACALAGLALPSPDGRADDAAQLTMQQVTTDGGEALPRPIVGVASPGGTALPFHLSFTFQCPPGTERRQLFVSVADTARIEDVTDEPSSRVLRVEVPLRELQWLAQPAPACAAIAGQRRPDEVGTDGARIFRMHAGTVGFATLTCGDDGGHIAAADATVPLDVWLSCPAEAPAP